MLLGLTEPDEGTVSVLGRRPAEAIAAGEVGVMLQTGDLISDLSVRELLAMTAVVDFPAPFGPRSARSSPLAIERSSRPPPARSLRSVIRLPEAAQFDRQRRAVVWSGRHASMVTRGGARR
jgi:hypothetical protein